MATNSTEINSLALGKFLHVVEFDIVCQLSITIDPDAINKKDFSSEPELSLEDFTSAYTRILKRKDSLLVENKYFVYDGEERNLSERCFRKKRRKFSQGVKPKKDGNEGTFAP